MSGRAGPTPDARPDAAWTRAREEAERLDAAVWTIAGRALTPWSRIEDFGGVLADYAVVVPTMPEARASTDAPSLDDLEDRVEARLDLAAGPGERLNVFTALWPERARVRAHALTNADGPRGALAGMIVAHKDCFRVAGHRMGVGANFPVESAPARETATTVRRIEEAGAVTLGALHLSEFVAGPTGQNPHLGDCLNPLSPDHIAGGSSSGSAAAVAAGIVDASLGSDTGGSIRLPASVCGCVGLKPTWGAVSRQGTFPRAASLDCVGPIARTVADCARVFSVIAGPDPLDPATFLRSSGASGRPVRSAPRVARLADDLIDPIDDDVRESFETALQALARETGPVTTVAPEGFSDLYVLGDVIAKAEASTLHAGWMTERPGDYSRAVFNRTLPGLFMAAPTYATALGVRAGVLKAFIDHAFADADAIVCPTLPIAVPLWRDVDMEAGEAVFRVIGEITRLTRPFSYLGLPVVTLPVGRDRAGLPVGLQIIGRPFAECEILDLASRLEGRLKMGRFIPSPGAQAPDAPR